MENIQWEVSILDLLNIKCNLENYCRQFYERALLFICLDVFTAFTELKQQNSSLSLFFLDRSSEVLSSSSVKSLPSPTSFFWGFSFLSLDTWSHYRFFEPISQSFNISDLNLPCLEQTQDTVSYFIPSSFIGLSPV